ncbi:diguanylate cyclase [Amycolatopsis sp. OK19-0408]|uniref:Diguanylate cyclase n=1 Tax=Amycolatopsis iheyensis TaxID=2945988 RepID=A0A9X2NPI3_9PSEU|nr:sensor domain-containing diguanylate cyclase [Amycolatopsis iheyensis]MCR6490547.1 diguanylate cyclase [Amycolatopsis iheyensis]
MIVVFGALAVTAATAFTVPVRLADLVRAAVLAAAAAAHIELTRHAERQREYLRIEGAPYVDLKSVWSFAGLIVLPPALASLMVIWTYAVAWWRIWPSGRPVPLYRWVFSAATVLIATQAAVAVLAAGMHAYPGPPAGVPVPGLLDGVVLVAAGLLRWFINTALVYVALALSTPDITVKRLFSNAGEYVLEAGALSLGVLAAFLVATAPILLAAVVVVLVALHRGLLVWQFQQQSRLDAKTALASPRWWTHATEKVLGTARPFAVLLLDVDRFKAINDTHGHPVGDQVLRAVADAIRGEIRHEDVAGRWGGEEFVITLPDVADDRTLLAIADRIRHRIAGLDLTGLGGLADGVAQVTVSIGAVRYPAPGLESVDDLIRAADAALYRAKAAGRDQVCLAEPGPAAP